MMFNECRRFASSGGRFFRSRMLTLPFVEYVLSTEFKLVLLRKSGVLLIATNSPKLDKESFRPILFFLTCALEINGSVKIKGYNQIKNSKWINKHRKNGQKLIDKQVLLCS
jgi:hypothetical protein